MFRSADPTIISRWGKKATFTPGDGSVSYEVVLVRDDEAEDFGNHTAPLLVLFGTLQDSGFVEHQAPIPQKNDRIEFDGAKYRIFEVKFDDAGGTQETAGMSLYCDQDPDV